MINQRKSSSRRLSSRWIIAPLGVLISVSWPQVVSGTADYADRRGEGAPFLPRSSELKRARECGVRARDIPNDGRHGLKLDMIPTISSGGLGGRKVDAPSPPTSSKADASGDRFEWFKPGSSRREKSLALWLLAWNSVALADALLFTFCPEQNLDGYLAGEWGPHALAQTRMLANCQLGLAALVTMAALCGDERMIKNTFKILILCTLGAFRAVAAGVAEGTIKAPWKEGKTFLMAGPPLVLLGYFAFVF